MYKKLLILTLFLSFNSLAESTAQQKMQKAKDAAKNVGPGFIHSAKQQKAAAKNPKKEELSDESLNALICPRVATQFTTASENALRAMHDLYDTLFESRDKSSEFYLMLLELNKSNPEHEEAASKIVEIKNGIDQKLSRAKLNYNQEIKSLATNIVRAKKCWSFHDENSKKNVGRFLEIYQNEPILEDFKKCVQIIEKNNRLYSSQFRLSVNYYNKAINKTSLINEASKIDYEITGVLVYENKQCGQFKNNGVYADYFRGKYDHKKETEVVKEVTPLKTATPAAKKDASPKYWKNFFGF